jgi:hypothetical protein
MTTAEMRTVARALHVNVPLKGRRPGFTHGPSRCRAVPGDDLRDYHVSPNGRSSTLKDHALRSW